MSRVAKNPITIPAGVEITINKHEIKVKGPKGTLEYHVAPMVEVIREDNVIKFSPKDGIEGADCVAGTTRALIKNMVTGVTSGYERKLVLIGVGFKAQTQPKVLNLVIGFSHPIKYKIPTGITIDTPSQTEIVVKGIDRQLVGQVAAEIRAFRPPEPYKGKGIRYEGEVVIQKEGKKK